MKRALSMLVVVTLLFVVVSAVGCAGTDKIGDILAKPLQYEGKDVNIKGYVGNTTWLSLVSKGSYEVGDGSGTIWVTTNQPPPQKGAKVSVTGKVTTAFKFGDIILGTAIAENKRN